MLRARRPPFTEVDMIAHRRCEFSLLPTALLITAVFACSIYANLSFTVKDRANHRYFPPFQPHVDANWNRALGGEYINIARSLVAGEGFSHPFGEATGPTAWQPPVLPALLACALWACGEIGRAHV